VRRRYLVEGAVQGVGFRHFAWRQGRRLGLQGWVRNLPDGRVEAVAEGDRGRLERFEAELARGPIMASVTQLQHSEIPDESEPLGSFEIR
jgi:acylphosphatase